MATTSLIENFQALAVKDDSDGTQPHSKCLPFNPGPDFGVSPGKVDRYLFRLFDGYSDGSMNDKWVKSKDADKAKFQHDKDAFARKDRHEVAQALRRHLKWTGQPDEEDNFVSWSSSLLFVLQYAHYRARRSRNSDFRQMFLCVVDTTLLPPKAFMRDVDLLTAFWRYDHCDGYDSLQGLQSLRKKRHAEYKGVYYFGEYLSQGALRIEHCCSIVSMADILDAGLVKLREELGDHLTTERTWANRVIEMREMFYEESIRYHAYDYEIKHALLIGTLFGLTWKVPIALAFLALKPRRIPDEAMVKEFRPLFGKGYEVFQLSPEAMVVVSNPALPEVQQFDELRQYLCKDAALSTILSKYDIANNELERVHRLAEQVHILGLKTPLRIKSQPHHSALNDLAQTPQELEKALSVVLKPTE